MKFQTLLAVLVIPAFSSSVLAQESKRADFTGCLKSISENSTAFKGKVFPLSSDGWSFAVNDEAKGTMTVHNVDGEAYTIDKSKKCSKATPAETKGKSGAGVVYHLYAQAMKDSKETSFEARSKIKEDCASVLIAGQKPGMGMMMNGGDGMMTPGQGMMMPGKAPAKKGGQ